MTDALVAPHTHSPQPTVAGIAMDRAEEHASRVFIQSPYDHTGRRVGGTVPHTYGRMGWNARRVALGLDALGVQPADRVALLGPNSPRWVDTLFGAGVLQAIVVPLYPTLDVSTLAWCLRDACVKVLFCHTDEHVRRALEARRQVSHPVHIVVMDPTAELPQTDDVLRFETLIANTDPSTDRASVLQERLRAVCADDTVVIVYTSGTTSRPRGVALSHANLNSQLAVAPHFGFRADDVWFAHLPLCHVLGLTADLLNAGYHGGTLFLLDSFDTSLIRAGLRACRPTVICSVPRLWERVYLQILAEVAQRPASLQRLFRGMLASAMSFQEARARGDGIPMRLRIAHKAAQGVFARVKGKAGLDRARICVTGGAKMHPELITFFRAIGIDLYQGYGLTETSPVTHVCIPGANKIGSVGKAIAGTECRIDVDGELLVKGPQVMRGYHDNAEATGAAFTADGFFRTGDIAQMDDEGFVTITDRKKELLVTSGGKNVAPQRIEGAFDTDPFIEQVCAIGDSRPYVAALLVPNYEAVQKWARANGHVLCGREKIAESDIVRGLVQERVDLVNATLSRPETIRRFTLLPQELTVEAGELTPTLKLKRRVIEQRYAEQIRALYPTGEGPGRLERDPLSV